MKLYNSLTRREEELVPSHGDTVTLYNCGPTVYWNMQIGNLRAYTFVDVLRRTIEYLGYDIKQVMNLTDVGHLSDDADAGEDKMEKTAEREKKDVWAIADEYIASVKSDFKAMNFLEPKRWVRATEHIEDMIDMIKKIEENGYTYETKQAVYFDVTKYHDYTRLQGGQALDEKKVGVRDEVNVDPEKKHPADFALWIRCVGLHEHHVMKWDSPWGVGFPGWHIECSAMGTKYLGTDIDIHTGGEDHIMVHHPNERAQNYGAYEKEVVKMWVHNLFLLVDGGKMGKSRGNMYELRDVTEKGFDPMDLRFFFLGAHYRKRQHFTWDNLTAARVSRLKLVDVVRGLQKRAIHTADGKVSEQWKAMFIGALEEDVMTPRAVAVVWDMLKDSNVSDADMLATLLDFDRVLGLQLDEVDTNEEEITVEMKSKIERIIEKRDQARKSKDWVVADECRKELSALGVEIEDTKDGTTWNVSSTGTYG